MLYKMLIFKFRILRRQRSSKKLLEKVYVKLEEANKKNMLNQKKNNSVFLKIKNHHIFVITKYMNSNS